MYLARLSGSLSAAKALASAGVGTFPVRSSDARRMNCSSVVKGAGVILLRSSSLRIIASISPGLTGVTGALAQASLVSWDDLGAGLASGAGRNPPLPNWPYDGEPISANNPVNAAAASQRYLGVVVEP